jgi:nucleotide-binding universal stress UspA family protein
MPRLRRAIDRSARDASLVVLGSRGHSRVGEVLIGSVSQHLAGHAPCPVAVIRPTASRDANRIVVGLDGSRASEAALTFACRRAHASLVVVGSRGLNAFADMLLGSVSHEVLHRAHCPVVVVR